MSDDNERVKHIAQRLADFLNERFPNDSGQVKNAALAVLICTAAIDNSIAYAQFSAAMKHVYMTLKRETSMSLQ